MTFTFIAFRCQFFAIKVTNFSLAAGFALVLMTVQEPVCLQSETPVKDVRKDKTNKHSCIDFIFLCCNVTNLCFCCWFLHSAYN